MAEPTLEKRPLLSRREQEAVLRRDLTRLGHPEFRLSDRELEELQDLRERTLRDLMEGPGRCR